MRKLIRLSSTLFFGTVAGLLCVSLLGTALVNSGVIDLAIAQTFDLPNNVRFNGQARVAALPPAGTNCTMTAGSTDLMGTCTETSSGPVVTFKTAYAATPFCIVAEALEPLSTFTYSVTTTAITVTNGRGSGLFTWFCLGTK
jgi:hypothetical protein